MPSVRAQIMHRTDAIPLAHLGHTKPSWSATASDVKTVASSMDSCFAFETPTMSGAMSLAELSVHDDRNRERIPVYRTPAATKPTADDTTAVRHGLSPHMVDALIRLAKETGTKLVEEAQASVQSPMTRPGVNLLSVSQGVELYENLRPASLSRPVESPHHSQSQSPKVSRTRALWNKLALRRKRSKPTSFSDPTHSPCLSSSPSITKPQPPATPLDDVPRIFGLTQVHVPLDELLEVVGHRSAFATSLLHPGMHRTSRSLRHSLLDTPDEHVCLRATTLPAPIASTSDPRDFLVAEYHHTFTTRTNRRGYAVVCHSVHWPQSPSPSDGAVRGSMYQSGLVAIESESDPDRVDLFCVAEMNLKGQAGKAENYGASHHRVLGTLARITQTVEERAKMLLSLDHTRVFFQKARRATAHDQRCSGCKDRIGTLPKGVEPYACRKCYAKVCADCSSIWHRGHKAMRLCMECWADATLNRT